MNVYLIVGDRKEVEKFCDALNLSDDARGGCWKITDKKGLESFLIWLDGFDQYHNMVHETLHLTAQMFKEYGVLFSADNEEMIAYYQNYWVRKFWNKMSKFKDKKGK